jgi:hypothetical protein
MTFRVCPPLVASAIVFCAFASACSGSSAAPQAFVEAQLASGATNGNCNLAGGAPLLQIGGVPDGGAAGSAVQRVHSGGANVVTCSVKGTGNNQFAVDAEVDQNSQVIGVGGSLRITGTVSQSGGSNIAVTLNTGGTTYKESDCSISFSGFQVSLGLPPAPPNVAAGRIWGTAYCPNAAATANGAQTVCRATADFVFENCGE